MRNAKSPRIPNYAIVRKIKKMIRNPYLGPEPHQKLISSSDW